MKAVLISIQPKWCELIASEKKTVEVRKTKPKLEMPFKCYIYCTKDNAFAEKTLRGFDDNGKAIYYKANKGKVIGEFICSSIKEFSVPYPAYFASMGDRDTRLLVDAQLTKAQAHRYLKEKMGFCWHITDLVIYDKPRELSEFEKPCICKGEYEGEEYCDCLNCELAGDSDYGIIACDRKIKRPPQSWCYVERSKG